MLDMMKMSCISLVRTVSKHEIAEGFAP